MPWLNPLSRLFPAAAILLLTASVAMADPPTADPLESTIRELHESLTRKDIASRYTRSDIEKYFQGRRDLDNFIVHLFQGMEDAGFSEHRLDSFELVSIEEKEGSRVAHLRLSGPWFLFLDTDFDWEEQWVQTPNGWMISHPILEGLTVP